MNRKLIPVVGLGVAVLGYGGLQLLGDGGEVPPEPEFPITRVVEDETSWSTELDWSPNGTTEDPFDTTAILGSSADEGDDAVEGENGVEAEAGGTPEGESGGESGSVGSDDVDSETPTTTTAPGPEAPPLAADGSGVDVPEIDDLPINPNR